MKLFHIFKQTILEQISKILSETPLDDPRVKEFYSVMGINPDMEEYEFWKKIETNGSVNPFKKGTWAYYKWLTMYQPWMDKSSGYSDTDKLELCKKNLSIRKRASKEAEKKYPEIGYIDPGDDDC